jgi:hypothetical protein
LFVWRVPRWKQFLIHTLRSWTTFHLVLYPIGGALFFAIATHAPALKGTWWYAIALAVLGLVALRFHTVCERLLHQSPAIASDADDSLAQGDIPPALLSDLSLIALIYALLVAFALGWPVFAALVVFLAASGLSRDKLWMAWPWSATVFRAAGAAALALAGFFFISQHTRLPGTAALIVLLAILHRLFMEIIWKKH